VIRRLALLCALCLAGAFSFRLYGETRYALRAAEPVAATVGGHDRLSGAVVLVFQPEDCFGSGGLLQRWDALRKEAKVPVLGRVVGRGALSARQQALFDSLRIEIPIQGIDPADVRTLSGSRDVEGTTRGHSRGAAPADQARRFSSFSVLIIFRASAHQRADHPAAPGTATPTRRTSADADPHHGGPR
jgi:hypothetical protein